MIFPAHVFESDQPPSNFALQMRKFVIFIGVIQFLCVLGRLIVGDTLGSLCMLFVVSMAYMISFGEPPLHIRWIFMWTFFCFINAGFDFAIAAVRSIHVYQHYDVPGTSNDIKSKVPVWQIVVVLTVSWLGALSEIFGAILGYKLYQDFQENELQAMQSLAQAHGFQNLNYGGMGRYSGAGAGAGSRGPSQPQMPGVAGAGGGGEPIQPFAGNRKGAAELPLSLSFVMRNGIEILPKPPGSFGCDCIIQVPLALGRAAAQTALQSGRGFAYTSSRMWVCHAEAASSMLFLLLQRFYNK
ncbi:unnamed protein product [Amoebophrya sp. A120]|nr:unnamed protein product [Amoebophrya sp. A120]|eukprot:GSA120T00014439001.1